MGFKLVGDLKKTLSGCDHFNDPLIMSTFILSSFNEEDLVLKMNECQNNTLDKNRKFILNYGTVRFGISAQEKSIIESTWKNLKREYELYERILKIEINPEKKLNLTQLKRQMAYYEGFDNFISDIILIYYAAVIQNPGLYESIMNKIINTPLPLFFLKNDYPYNIELQLLKKLSDILEFIDQNVDETNKTKLFKIKLAIEANKFFKDQNKDLFELPSFSSMNDLLQSPNTGANILNIWLPWAVENFPKNKIEDTFIASFENVDWMQLWALKYYFIEQPKIREKVFTKLETMLKSDDLKKKILFYEIQSNKNWQKYFNDKISKFSIQSIKQKRFLYQGLIKENQGISYAVFKLFKLGDFSRDYFIKLLAVKSYGISTTNILPLQR